MYNKNMSTKRSSKTNINDKGGCGNWRVKVNVCLLALMTAAFAVLTVLAGQEALRYKKGMMTVVSDAPALCHDDERYAEQGTIEGAYVCRIDQYDENGEPARTDELNDHTFFLQDTIMFSREVEIFYFRGLAMFIGALFTIAGVGATVVYWNHNR